MAHKVNLDALIPRDDFEMGEPTVTAGIQKHTISINDLKKGEFFYSYLRKPDFQRETSEWDAQKLSNLILSFLNNDLIPAIILWKNGASLTFVIDGSHRLSALAAWINDDYGDGKISKDFFDARIPDEQQEIANKTRKLVNSKIGLFSDYQLANTNPEKVKAEIVSRAKQLGALSVQLQWVNGDARKAEESFFTINQQASPINQTELRILRARKTPQGIAARAIFRAGQGHKYWSAFPEDARLKVLEASKEIHELLFVPKLKTPIKTLDIPIGGKVNSANALALVLDFIYIVNGIKIEKESVSDEIRDDIDDSKRTLMLLKQCIEIAKRINSVHPGSLGLHPAIYFYSRDGGHKVATFYAISSLMLEIGKKNLWNTFIEIRSKLESFLLSNDELIQQIVRKHRGAFASHEYIKDFLLMIINELKTKGIDKALESVIATQTFSYLKLGTGSPQHEASQQEFTRAVKSKTFLAQALAGAVKCSICDGYLHTNSTTVDHIARKRDGGRGGAENAQLAHPYCNSTYKN
ncbi:HNH endonuclease [Nitrosospira sp. Nl5]|uniref:HNH endonuclease family protein n=1 Tax=Nitrosospira sp. Nl5 TaxID=200120 RepID=UPI0008825934|nr:DUF262 domain-containing protein [Nitrosospira sp. Nl5]SCY53402.1 HNH endonuclease [Nitrosospira sp. Nl5]